MHRAQFNALLAEARSLDRIIKLSPNVGIPFRDHIFEALSHVDEDLSWNVRQQI